MNYDTFFRIRVALAALMIGGAVWSIVAVASTSGFAPGRVAHVVFWTLVPPMWFFFEYYAIDRRWMTHSSIETSDLLSSVKDYADYSSKIWAAVLAVVALLFTKT